MTEFFASFVQFKINYNVLENVLFYISAQVIYEVNFTFLKAKHIARPSRTSGSFTGKRYALYVANLTWVS